VRSGWCGLVGELWMMRLATVVLTGSGVCVCKLDLDWSPNVVIPEVEVVLVAESELCPLLELNSRGRHFGSAVDVGMRREEKKREPVGGKVVALYEVECCENGGPHGVGRLLLHRLTY
jgi:hypothetical protein